MEGPSSLGPLFLTPDLTSCKESRSIAVNGVTLQRYQIGITWHGIAQDFMPPDRDFEFQMTTSKGSLGGQVEDQTIKRSYNIWQVCANACWINGIALCSDTLLGASVVWPVRLCKLCPLCCYSGRWIRRDLG